MTSSSDPNMPLIAPFPGVAKVHLWAGYELLRLLRGRSVWSAIRLGVLFGMVFGGIQFAQAGLSWTMVGVVAVTFMPVTAYLLVASRVWDRLLPGSSERVDYWKGSLLHQMGHVAIEGTFEDGHC